MERKKKFRFVHGFLKGVIVNVINIAHSKIPPELIVKPDTVTDSVELVNMKKAIDLGMKQFEKYNAPGFTTDHKYAILQRFEDLIFTGIDSDTAYYLILEYILKEYMVIKMKDNFSKNDILDMFEEQQEKMLDSMDSKSNT